MRVFAQPAILTRGLRVAIVAAIAAFSAAAALFVSTPAYANPAAGYLRASNWEYAWENQTPSGGTEPENPVVLPEELTVTEDGLVVFSHRVMIQFDGSVSPYALTVRLQEQGVDVTALTLLSRRLAGNEVLVLVEYAGDADPVALCAQLEQLDFITMAEPDEQLRLKDADDEPAEGAGEGGEGESGEGSGRGRAAGDGVIGGIVEPGSGYVTDADLNVNDTYASALWGLVAVNVGDAWQMVRCEGRIAVAVIDTGVQANHPDLIANLVPTSIMYNTYTDTFGADGVADLHGHGTHVCGIIGAKVNNGIGVAGASYDATILPIRACHQAMKNGVLTDGYFAASDVIEALDYIISLKEDNVAGLGCLRVVNLSLGGYTYSRAYEGACVRAEAAGLLLVAAAGNDATSSLHYPATYAPTLGVSAVYRSNGQYFFADTYSNYGVYVDITAPGTRIMSTYTGSGYVYMTGTSMATPIVSGVAALVFAANPNLTPAQVKNILMRSAMDMGAPGRDDYYGAGLVDAALAVELASGPTVAQATAAAIEPVEFTGTAVTPAVDLTWLGIHLIEGVDYTLTYENNVDVGIATVTVRGIGLFTGEKQLTFRITGVELPLPTVVEGLHYVGALQVGVVFPAVCETEGTWQAEAPGTYSVTVSLPGGNYSWSDGTTAPVTLTWEISSELDLSGITFEGRTVTYTGQPTPLAAEGRLPVAVQVSYLNNDCTELGDHTVTAQFSYTCDGTTYSQSLTATLTILPVKVSVPRVTTLTYNGAEQMGVVPTAGSTVRGNVATQVGEYTAVAALADSVHSVWDAEGMDDPTANIELPWSIAMGVYDLSGITFYDALVEHDGEAHAILIDGDLPEGVEVTYDGNGVSEPGKYTIIAHFTGDTLNYEPIPDMKATLTIYAPFGGGNPGTPGAPVPLDLGDAITEIPNGGFFVDGVRVPAVMAPDGRILIQLPDDGETHTMVGYDMAGADDGDPFHAYPTHVSVWYLDKDEDSGMYEAVHLEALDDGLQYAGSSIRIAGVKGVRMITAVPNHLKSIITRGGLEFGGKTWTLEEYGTLIAFDSALDGADVLLTNTRFQNFAYKRGVADPVFSNAGGRMSYTNVLVGFSLEQCAESLAMRPYMLLTSEDGDEFVIYGGTVHRSIGYIAWQNRNAFAPGTDAYNYIWDIIHAVYGEDFEG